MKRFNSRPRVGANHALPVLERRQFWLQLTPPCGANGGLGQFFSQNFCFNSRPRVGANDASNTPFS